MSRLPYIHHYTKLNFHSNILNVCLSLQHFYKKIRKFKLEQYLYYCMGTPFGLLQIAQKKVRWEQHKDAAWCFEQILEPTSHKKAVEVSFTSYLTNCLNEQDILGITGNILLWTFPHVQTLDAMKRNCYDWWPLGMDSKRESMESMSSTCLDGNEEYIYSLIIKIFSIVFYWFTLMFRKFLHFILIKWFQLQWHFEYQQYLRIFNS